MTPRESPRSTVGRSTPRGTVELSGRGLIRKPKSLGPDGVRGRAVPVSRPSGVEIRSTGADRLPLGRRATSPVSPRLSPISIPGPPERSLSVISPDGIRGESRRSPEGPREESAGRVGRSMPRPGTSAGAESRGERKVGTMLVLPPGSRLPPPRLTDAGTVGRTPERLTAAIAPESTARPSAAARTGRSPRAGPYGRCSRVGRPSRSHRFGRSL